MLALAGDAEALAEFDAAYPRLVAAAYRAVVRFFRYSPERVEDVVAETMARTYERWERVRRHDNPAGWVVVCAKNVCLEQLRADARASRWTRTGRDLDRHKSDDLAHQTALSATIWRSLDDLSKRQRDVAVMRYLMDCDEATTAIALGMSVSKVKTAAHEARSRLRTLLADLYIDVDEAPA
jgi:RNA polymerase sigma factor (sigma-70 family)